MIRSPLPPPETKVGEPETDPVVVAQIHAALARHAKNEAWFEARAAGIVHNNPGQFICVAGEELFVGDEPRELYVRARAAHPEDWGGFFTYYISPRPGIKIYAIRW